MRVSPNSLRAACAAALAVSSAAAAAQAPLLLDGFDAGDQSVSASTGPTFGTPVPGVFTGNRILLLVKADEASAAAVAVGGGQLSVTQTGLGRFGDFAAMYNDRITAPTDVSAYNAFQLTVVSAPAAPARVDFVMVFSLPGLTLSRRATADIPASGQVTVPFTALSRSDGQPFDLTQVRGVGLEFSGVLMPAGTYVFDNFMLAAVPEPGAAALLAAGLVLLAWRRRAAVRRPASAR